MGIRWQINFINDNLQLRQTFSKINKIDNCKPESPEFSMASIENSSPTKISKKNYARSAQKSEDLQEK